MSQLSYKPKTSQIPTDAGVYRFFDKNGEIIYVGKAKSLRNRLTDYFQDLSKLTPKTRVMVTTAVHVDWTVVQSEIEALTLEYAWIKEYQPRFNIMYRDDKSYPYLAVTMNEEFPRVMITRDAHKNGVKYFGPYSKVWAIRETMDNLCKVFKTRTCSNAVFNSSKLRNRPCLLGDIGKCSAPCVGRISKDNYYNDAKNLCSFVSGKTGNYFTERKKVMTEAASELNFEKAARIRDEIIALEKVLEKNTIVLSDETDADVFAMKCDELTASIVLFHVRAGRIRATKTWIGERLDDSNEHELLSMFLINTYSEYNENEISRLQSTSVDDKNHYGIEIIPKEILVSHELEDSALIEYLSNLRKAKIQVRVPVRGDKATLMDTAIKNASHTLEREKLKRLNDITTRSVVLEQMRDIFEMDTVPLRIECYDSSHIQGTNHVASMVVFEDGLPKKKDYRSYSISLQEDGSLKDDTAALYEVLSRRFARLLEEESSPIASIDDNGVKTVRRFSYRPDLLVIDGGLPQVNTAKKVLDNFGLDIPVIGLAKRLEEIYFPNEDFPLILPRRSQILYMLQYIRDESHRFAITLHRKKRTKTMFSSVLDNIDGVGKTRKKALLQHFGSISAIRKASVKEIASVKGISEQLAENIYSVLKSQDK
ncbi:excinuclease ABC subunit UvrC [Actinomyces sp. zg-332]|uniref:excinuclease ABC subunit UvrC n=1 Tax=Actinomyces sp. zg-332 TaxID=2708340 RepID=UPI0014206C7A|nr:excinuclease ABC subunit UvrC [Actinomyces sp. zg-332]QPK94625.1 excinuclease ABC subunit UvrC [Actinomyces sp. zg-332]